jgi:hypothetical protein
MLMWIVGCTVKLLAELVPTLPAPSDCDACAVYLPGGSAVVPVTDHDPPEAVVDSVCVGVPVAVVPA